MVIRVPVNQANFVKENIAWIADSLGNELRPLLASDKLIYRSEDEKLDEIERNTITYRVQSGDNLGKIAQNYRVSVSQIKEWNNLYSNLIRVGQRLTLHAPEGAAPARSMAKVQTNSTGQKNLHCTTGRFTLDHFSAICRTDRRPVEKTEQPELHSNQTGTTTHHWLV